MKSIFLALVAALLVHGLLFLFGGVFFFTDEEQKARAVVREVELFSEEPEPPAEANKPDRRNGTGAGAEVEDEKPPEMAELVKQDDAVSESRAYRRRRAAGRAELERPRERPLRRW